MIRDAEILGPPPYCMEIPLWDLLGKAAGLPVYRLWGGRATRSAPTARPANCAPRRARRRRGAAGATTASPRSSSGSTHDDPRDDLAVAEAVRDAVGDDGGADGRRQPGRRRPRHRADTGRGTSGLRSRWPANSSGSARTGWRSRCPGTTSTGLARLRDRLETLRLAGGEDDHGLHEFQLLLRAAASTSCNRTRVKSETASAIRALAAFADAGRRGGRAAHVGQRASACWCTCISPRPARTAATLEFPHDPPSGLTAAARDSVLAEPITHRRRRLRTSTGAARVRLRARRGPDRRAHGAHRRARRLRLRDERRRMKIDGRGAGRRRARRSRSHEVDLGPPGPGEVLVRIAASGLCASDLNAIDGKRTLVPFPAVLGHEAAGIVVRPAPASPGCGPGIRSCSPSCRPAATCPYCAGAAGPTTAPPRATRWARGNLFDGTGRLRRPGGERLHHFLTVSSFAEYAVVPSPGWSPSDRTCRSTGPR